MAAEKKKMETSSKARLACQNQTEKKKDGKKKMEANQTTPNSN